MRWRGLAVSLAIGIGLLIPLLSASATTIAEAVDWALSQHSELRQANLSLRLAELELDAALASYSLPSLSFQVQLPSLTLGGLSGELSGSLGGSVSLPLGSSAQLSGSLGLAWNADDGSWALDGWSLKYSQRIDFSQSSSSLSEIERKKEAVADSEASLADTRNAVILETIETYGRLLSDEDAVSQAELQLQQANDDLASIEALVEEGIRGASALNQARLSVLEAEIRLDRLRTAYEQDLATFARESLRTSEPIKLFPFELQIDVLREAVAVLVNRDDLIDEAVEASTAVRSALQSVESAHEDLTNKLREVLPNLSIEAGYTNGMWAIGGSIEFDFFSPDRGDQIAIARTSLALAEEKLDDVSTQQKNVLLNQQAGLVESLRDLDRLALEEEKWDLEEQVMTVKYEVGSIGDADWEEYVESRDAFLLEASQREASLLLAHLKYRDALGLELDWEEWLQ
jgi:outer membrane protein TolC